MHETTTPVSVGQTWSRGARPGPLRVTAVVAGLGASATVGVAIPAMSRISAGYAIVFGLLTVIVLGALLTGLLRPSRPGL